MISTLNRESITPILVQFMNSYPFSLTSSCHPFAWWLEGSSDHRSTLLPSSMLRLHYLNNKQTWISNGNTTEWSPIRSVIIQVITKSDDSAAGVRFVYYEYDYRQNWTTQSLITISAEENPNIGVCTLFLR